MPNLREDLGDRLLDCTDAAQLCNALTAAPPDQLRAYVSAYEEALLAALVSHTHETEVCPYIPWNIGSVRMAGDTGELIIPAPEVRVSRELLQRSLDAAHIRPLLVYAHAVAIDDPLLAVLSRYVRFRNSSERVTWSNNLTAALSMLDRLQPLIDGGMLVLVPGSVLPQMTVSGLSGLAASGSAALTTDLDVRPAIRATGYETSLTVERQIAYLMDRIRTLHEAGEVGYAQAGEHLIEAVRADPENAEALRVLMAHTLFPKKRWVERAIDTILRTSALRELCPLIDYYFPWPHYETVANWLARNRDQEPMGTHSWHLGNAVRLMSVGVPRLTHLPTTDMIALRRDSEAFAEWRAFIGDVARQSQADADMSRLRAEWADAAAYRVARIDAELAKTRVGAAVRRSAAAFALGALPAVAAAPRLDGIEAGLASGAVAAAAEAARSLRRLPPAKAQRALRAHFLLLT